MNVVKANGAEVPFDEERVRRSLRRAGAKPRVIDEIADLVKTKMYDRIPTSELYSIVFSELKRLQTPAAGKYNLKRAIFQLGPTGFPFEKLIAALFDADGFTASTGQFIKGRCVGHEVDVVARKGDLLYHAECKFHSFQGAVCDVKHALYVDARFRDIGKRLGKDGAGGSPLNYQGWLVTNTRFTTVALAYGTCAGLDLLSWDFPEKRSLRSWIDSSGLHPVTCLTSLSTIQKRRLLERGIVLCRDLRANTDALASIGVRGRAVGKVVEEIDSVCQSLGAEMLET